MDVFATLRNTAASLEAACTQHGITSGVVSGDMFISSEETGSSLSATLNSAIGHAWAATSAQQFGGNLEANIAYAHVLARFLTAGDPSKVDFQKFLPKSTLQDIQAHFAKTAKSQENRKKFYRMLSAALNAEFIAYLHVQVDADTPGTARDMCNPDVHVRPLTREDIQKVTSQVTF